MSLLLPEHINIDFKNIPLLKCLILVKKKKKCVAYILSG